MDRAKFYAELRKRGSGVFGTSLSQGQVDTLELILDEGQARGVRLPQLAYVLATVYHEVGATLRPVSENLNYSAKRIRQVWPSRFRSVADAKPYANNPRRLANKVYADRLGNGPEASGDGWTYRGRGFCQCTGEANYAKFAKLLGIDLVANPDRAMEPVIAVKVLFEGMIGGLFTGRKLSDYFDDKGDFIGARAIINADVGSNGEKVAGYAKAFAAALTAAGYVSQAPKTLEMPAAPVPIPLPNGDLPADQVGDWTPITIGTGTAQPPAPSLQKTQTTGSGWLSLILSLFSRLKGA
jgi:putative chitinase